MSQEPKKPFFLDEIFETPRRRPEAESSPSAPKSEVSDDSAPVADVAVEAAQSASRAVDFPLSEMVRIAPGTFLMGSPDNEPDRVFTEVRHEVTLTPAYWLGRTPVTQAQWRTIMATEPSSFKGDDLPVENVSWEDAMEYCLRLTDRERRAGRLPAGYAYTLPTEAQWEYACRAGSEGPYAEPGVLGAMGWYKDNSGKSPHAVAQKAPNSRGLYDMHGNVWEWCWDWYGSYPAGSVIDPAGPNTGDYRVFRGGSWMDSAAGCRAAYRSRSSSTFLNYNLGFRLCLSPENSAK